MIVITYFSVKYRRQFWLFLLIGMMLSSIVVSADAQKPKKTRSLTRSVSSSIPSGYSQLGSTDILYKISSNSIDIQGKYNDKYYGSTFSNNGYKVAMQVGSNSAVNLNPLDGSTSNGVSFSAEIIPQGELGRVCYYISNTTENDVIVSLGIHADVMIGSNDAAPIRRKIDTIGNTYGLALLNSRTEENPAQLCVLFGTGLPGVTGVDDFWFGHYSLNRSASAMVGNYSSGSNYMVENGSYDSGMGWCWKNRIIPAGETVTFSWLIGVGEVNLEPNSNFEVTPEDPDGWNDLSRLHVLTLEGDYESPAGLNGRIEYAIEDSEDWIALTEMLESGSTFTGEVRAMFDPAQARHTIRFRTVDQVGNTSLLPSIVYPDVSFHALEGVVEKTYTGEPVYQATVTCDLGEDRFELKNYQNNVNAGTATFNMEGVFPYTIGRKTYNFTINPATLVGEISIDPGTYVYDGNSKTPGWSFTEDAYATLEYNKDYSVNWSDNILPGTATLTVSGKGNYTGTLSQTFLIDKAQLTASQYEVTLPNEDISYDESTHGASIVVSEGVGVATITYKINGTAQTAAPSQPGSYDIYLEIAEGTLYYGLASQKIGSFTIYQFDETDWQNLQTLRDQLAALGWEQSWDMSQGAKSASSLNGLSVQQGHVVGLDFSNLGLTGSIPSAISSFPTLKSLDLSGNSLSGNIGGLFADGSLPCLTILQASGNHFSEVSPVLPSTVTTLDLTGQETGQVIVSDMSGFGIEQVPSLLLYDHTNHSYHTARALQLTNYPPTVTDYNADKPFWGFKALGLDGSSPQLTCLSVDNTYYGQSGDILYYTYPSSSNEVANSFCQFKFNFAQGDVNMFGGVDILDLQAMISYMVEEYNRPFNYTAANLWVDGGINVQDAVLLVNKLLEMDNTSGVRTRASVSEYEGDAEAVVYCQDGELRLFTTKEIAAFDIVVSGCNAIEIAEDLFRYGLVCGVKQSGNKTHLVGYSLTKGCLPQGDIVIGSLSADGIPSVCGAALSDLDATKVLSGMNPSDLTGIRSVKNCSDGDIRYRLPLGHNHTMMIDVNGKKTIK